MIAPHIDMLSDTEIGEQAIAAESRRGAWRKRMRARPSMRATTWEALQRLPEPA